MGTSLPLRHSYTIRDNRLFKRTLNKDFTLTEIDTLNRLHVLFFYTLNWDFRLPALSLTLSKDYVSHPISLHTLNMLNKDNSSTDFLR